MSSNKGVFDAIFTVGMDDSEFRSGLTKLIDDSKKQKVDIKANFLGNEKLFTDFLATIKEKAKKNNIELSIDIDQLTNARKEVNEFKREIESIDFSKYKNKNLKTQDLLPKVEYKDFIRNLKKNSEEYKKYLEDMQGRLTKYSSDNRSNKKVTYESDQGFELFKEKVYLYDSYYNEYKSIIDKIKNVDTSKLDSAGLSSLMKEFQRAKSLKKEIGNWNNLVDVGDGKTEVMYDLSFDFKKVETDITNAAKTLRQEIQKHLTPVEDQLDGILKNFIGEIEEVFRVGYVEVNATPVINADQFIGDLERQLKGKSVEIEVKGNLVGIEQGEPAKASTIEDGSVNPFNRWRIKDGSFKGTGLHGSKFKWSGDSFDFNKTKKAQLGSGMYFTADTKIVSEFGKNIHTAELELEKCFVLTREHTENIADLYKAMNMSVPENVDADMAISDVRNFNRSSLDNSKTFRQNMLNMGYQGMFIGDNLANKNISSELVVYDENKLKDLESFTNDEFQKLVANSPIKILDTEPFKDGVSGVQVKNNESLNPSNDEIIPINVIPKVEAPDFIRSVEQQLEGHSVKVDVSVSDTLLSNPLDTEGKPKSAGTLIVDVDPNINKSEFEVLAQAQLGNASVGVHIDPIVNPVEFTTIAERQLGDHKVKVAVEATKLELTNVANTGEENKLIGEVSVSVEPRVNVSEFEILTQAQLGDASVNIETKPELRSKEFVAVAQGMLGDAAVTIGAEPNVNTTEFKALIDAQLSGIKPEINLGIKETGITDITSEIANFNALEEKLQAIIQKLLEKNKLIKAEKSIVGKAIPNETRRFGQMAVTLDTLLDRLLKIADAVKKIDFAGLKLPDDLKASEMDLIKKAVKDVLGKRSKSGSGGSVGSGGSSNVDLTPYRNILRYNREIYKIEELIASLEANPNANNSPRVAGLREEIRILEEKIALEEEDIKNRNLDSTSEGRLARISIDEQEAKLTESLNEELRIQNAVFDENARLIIQDADNKKVDAEWTEKQRIAYEELNAELDRYNTLKKREANGKSLPGDGVELESVESNIQTIRNRIISEGLIDSKKERDFVNKRNNIELNLRDIRNQKVADDRKKENSAIDKEYEQNRLRDINLLYEKINENQKEYEERKARVASNTAWADDLEQINVLHDRILEDFEKIRSINSKEEESQKYISAKRKFDETDNRVKYSTQKKVENQKRSDDKRNASDAEREQKSSLKKANAAIIGGLYQNIESDLKEYKSLVEQIAKGEADVAGVARKEEIYNRIFETLNKIESYENQKDSARYNKAINDLDKIERDGEDLRVKTLKEKDVALIKEATEAAKEYGDAIAKAETSKLPIHLEKAGEAAMRLDSALEALEEDGNFEFSEYDEFKVLSDELTKADQKIEEARQKRDGETRKAQKKEAIEAYKLLQKNEEKLAKKRFELNQSTIHTEAFSRLTEEVRELEQEANDARRAIGELFASANDLMTTDSDIIDARHDWHKAQGKYGTTAGLGKFAVNNSVVLDYESKSKTFRSASEMSATYNNMVDEVKAKIAELKKLTKDGIVFDENADLEHIKTLKTEIDDLFKSIKNSGNDYELAGNDSIEKLRSYITASKNRNSGALDFVDRYDELLDRLAKKPDRRGLREITADFKELEVDIANAGQAGLSFFDLWKKRVGNIGLYLTSFFSFWDIVNKMRQMLDITIDLNTQMIELSKVSNTTMDQLDSRFDSFADSAKDLGATISDTISATADWSRLGHEVDVAQELAEAALIYKNVGDGIDIDTANKSLVSTMQGFELNVSDAMEVIDKFNEVANNFPIDSAGIGEALQRSAASFHAANTDLSKSIALIAGTNAVVQDPDSVGTMWRTVSMRIRGAKAELEAAGEETDGMVESTSQLRDLVLGMTGFDIMEDDNTFKDIYEIIIGIGKEWKNLTDIDRASLLEKLAGKMRSNSLAAALNNIEMIEEAYSAAENSAGSAMAEQERYEQSLQYSLDRFSAAVENLSHTLLESGVVDWFVDLGTAGVDALESIIDATGPLSVAFTGLGGLLGSQGLGLTNYVTIHNLRVPYYKIV